MQRAYMDARMERLLAEVDGVARSSLRREQAIQADPFPLLSRMPDGGASVVDGAFVRGQVGAPSTASHPQERMAYGAVPRVQESRAARRNMASPINTPMRNRGAEGFGMSPLSSTPQYKSARGGLPATLPHVGATPTTPALYGGAASATGARHTCDALARARELRSCVEQELAESSAAAGQQLHAAGRAASRQPSRGAAPRTADDELPVTQDEAASLLLALPLSRDPSFNPPSHPPSTLTSPRAQSTLNPGFVSPTPWLNGVPMSKQASTLSVSGFLTSLDE